jgi:hypothetical protein
MQSDSIGVERRRLPFTLIENIVLEDQALGPVDILVYLALAKHSDGEGTCWPSLSTIAKLARVHRSSVAQAIKRLEARGYLRRTARFRPDGGVTSNAYQLMPMEAQKYPPVAQDNTPRRLGRLAPVAQDDTNYTHLELDPSKERAVLRPDKAPQNAQEPSHELAPHSLSPLLERIQQEAQARGAPLCFMAGGWSSGILSLVRGGVSEEEIVKAFTVCIETAPERVTFFSRDFLKWRKVSRERLTRERQIEQQGRDRDAIDTEREAEREKILAEHRDPQVAAQIEAMIASLPWKRVRGEVI